MKENFINKENILILLLALTGLTIVGQLYLPIPLLGKLHLAYNNINYPDSIIISSFGFSYAIGFLFFGKLSDNIGRKNTILSGLVILIFITYWISHIHNFNTLLIARVAQGFFAASFPPVALAYIGESISASKRSWAVSLISLSFLSAVALAQVFTILLNNNSLEKSEFILAFCYLFFTLAFFSLLEKKDRNVNTQNNIFAIIKSLFTTFFNRKLIIYYAISFSVLLMFVGFYIVLNSEMRQIKSQFNPLSLRLISLPFFCSCFFAGKMLTRYGRRKSLCALFTLISLMFILSIIGSQYNLFIMKLIALCGLSICIALAVPSLITIIATNANPQEKGTAVSFYTFILFCGASFSPLLFQKIISNFNYLYAWYVLLAISSINIIFSILTKNIEEK